MLITYADGLTSVSPLQSQMSSAPLQIYVLYENRNVSAKDIVRKYAQGSRIIR